MGEEVSPVDTSRPMAAEDVDAVLEIDRLSFPTAWARESYLRDLDNPHCCYFVVEREGQVVAYAGMWVVREEAHLTTLAVNPNHRRQGLGKRLLREMICIAIRRGALKMTLEVRAENQVARRLYEAHGFLPIACQKGYYLDTGEDAVVMCCNPLRV